MIKICVLLITLIFTTKNLLAETFDIYTNQMYQNDILKCFTNANNTSNILLHILKPKHIISELKAKYLEPELFLEAQKKLIYGSLSLISPENIISIWGCENVKIFEETDSTIGLNLNITKGFTINRRCTIMNDKGLPTQNNFYATASNSNKPILKLSEKPPRILNIASGSNPDKKMYAINIDLNTIGNPEIICDARDLSVFPDNHFTVVRASHILEHFYPDEIKDVLTEWIRVLHENGELHIAVPDARVVLEELESGKTKKSNFASLDLLNTTAPIAQLYGVGYEDAKTDARWRHHIVFNYELLCWYLKQVGLEVVELMTNLDDMAGACGIKDDSQNHYSLIVRARRTIKPHAVKKKCSPEQFNNKLNNFKQKNSSTKLPPLSIIVPVRNEATNLPTFLNNLLNIDLSANNLFEREYIIVCNGTTDNSVEIVNDFIKNNPTLTLRLIFSEVGVLNAFHTGICARQLDGFVAKLDADCIVHNNALCLMYINLFEAYDLQVTYAEPIPVGIENEFNKLQFHQALRSQRLYIHGRCSMYKTNPFNLFNFDMIQKAGCMVEDIILSYCYIFFCGLDSIKGTDYATIYSKPVDNRDDFEKKIIRTKREIYLIEKSFPYLIPFRNMLDRKLIHQQQDIRHGKVDSILKLYERLKQENPSQLQNHDWDRLESTKNSVLITI